MEIFDRYIFEVRSHVYNHFLVYVCIANNLKKKDRKEGKRTSRQFCKRTENGKLIEVHGFIDTYLILKPNYY